MRVKVDRERRDRLAEARGARVRETARGGGEEQGQNQGPPRGLRRERAVRPAREFEPDAFPRRDSRGLVREKRTSQGRRGRGAAQGRRGRGAATASPRILTNSSPHRAAPTLPRTAHDSLCTRENTRRGTAQQSKTALSLTQRTERTDRLATRIAVESISAARSAATRRAPLPRGAPPRRRREAPASPRSASSRTRFASRRSMGCAHLLAYLGAAALALAAATCVAWSYFGSRVTALLSPARREEKRRDSRDARVVQRTWHPTTSRPKPRAKLPWGKTD